MAAVHLRKVRSFVRRPGRLTPAQRRALDELLPRFAIPAGDAPIDWRQAYGRDAPRVAEIGFGDGEALLTSAANHPEIDYVGIEVHEPGIGHLCLLLERAGVGNVRIIDKDAADVLPARFADACLDAVNLFFPDPWPKKRHHKRRLVQPAFVAELARVLKSDGLFHLATDWPDYAAHAQAMLQGHRSFDAIDAASLALDPFAFRPPTKFERRGRRLGHDVVDLYYRKRG
jgi:tRNA (guanine-N7-)-methyltransferase